MNKLNRVPVAEDLIQTHEKIRHMIHRTPVMRCKSIDEISGAEIYFKCENLQKIGAFKMRGAASASLRMEASEKEKGITTHSSGNHAQAVALSAKLLGIPAYIVMPKNAPASKRAATEGYGAEIISSEASLESRETMLEAVLQKTGATFIHPYNDYNVIAGQATAAKELFEDAPLLDFVMPPVGGGGLLSGTALSTRYFSPKTKVIAGEPKEVDDAFRSFTTGTIQQNTTIDTIADGLRTNLGEKNFDIIQKYVDDIITVSEASIVEAMRLIWERMKMVVEPSGVVPLAAVLSRKSFFKGKKIGIILSGGNVDLGKLPF